LGINNQKYSFFPFHPLNIVIVIQIAPTVLVIYILICTSKRSLGSSLKKKKRKKEKKKKKKKRKEKVLSPSILQSLQSSKERSIPSRSKVR
jgi:short subunit fatty acids transporter